MARRCGGIAQQIVRRGALAVALLAAMLFARAASAQQAAPASASFAELARVCAPHVDVTTLAALVRVESGFNPYAIGIVGTHLQSQPRSYPEALAIARALVARGYNFSVGLGQVNVRNLARVGENLATIFEPCRNLRAASTILQQCFARSSARGEQTQRALRDALSCYYSGNFWTGYRQGYVERVIASAAANRHAALADLRETAGAPPTSAASLPPRAASIIAATTRPSPSTPHAQPKALRAHASATPGTATRSATPARFAEQSADHASCTNGSMQSVTVRCRDDRRRWCVRCIDTAPHARRSALIVER